MIWRKHEMWSPIRMIWIAPGKKEICSQAANALRGKGMIWHKIRQPDSRTVWAERDCTLLVKYAIKEENAELLKKIGDANRKTDNARELMLSGGIEPAEYRKLKEEVGSKIA